MANAYYKSGSSWINMANIFYPVGAYYLANVGTSPSNLFGGTWQQVSDARFLCAWNSAGGGGGENAHVLTVSEMPSHSHQLHVGYTRNTGGTNTLDFGPNASVFWSASYTANSGGSSAHNNMPLYRTCYCWYRTA